jgi:hypothetical protein
MFDVLSDISRLLGTTSTEVFSGDTLAFVNRHARFPRPGEPLELDELQVADATDANDSLISLRQKLDKLERLPENETERFKLETEIYKLDQEREEWPEVIAA